jgi:predicted secreted hydrolase
MPVFLLALCLLLCAIPAMADEAASWPRADPGYQIRFPLDEGSHPAFAGEWWYLTGWLETPEQQPLGFQVTFFRFRQKVDTAVPERTPPAQVLVGHAALSDPRRGPALHDQRTTSAEPGRAEALQGTMDVRIDDWLLRKEGEAYVALFPARDFELDLRFTPTQPLSFTASAALARRLRIQPWRATITACRICKSAAPWRGMAVQRLSQEQRGWTANGSPPRPGSSLRVGIGSASTSLTVVL